ncbi:MAG: hypothetical protein JO218_18340 [Burkholderiales bacterium]|nr:hypothetical protein [Burkholderiales bacterium]
MAQAFRLALQLATPFAVDHPLTLDGLLSAAVFRATGKRGRETIPEIPLVRELDVFHGSSLHYSKRYAHEPVHRVMSLRHRRDLSPELFSPNRKRGNGYLAVDQQRGAYKANLSSYAGIAADEVFFWGLGDGEACVHLIATYLLGIGKRANAGAGQIYGVHLEASNDHSWIAPSGRPARPLPVELWREIGAVDMEVAPMTVDVPYWSGAQVAAVFPTTPVV